MRKRFWCQFVIVVTVLALVATPALAAQKKQKPIKIGLLYALSGLAAVYTKGTIIGHDILTINHSSGRDGPSARSVC